MNIKALHCCENPIEEFAKTSTKSSPPSTGTTVALITTSAPSSTMAIQKVV